MRQLVYRQELQKHMMSHRLPLADIAGFVFVSWAACATSNTIHILIALGGVFSKVDSYE